MYLNMQNLHDQVELRGITKNDLQDIYDAALRESKTRLFFLDASYLYTFHLDDFVEVKKFNLLGRYYSQELIRLNKLIRDHKPIDMLYYDQINASNSSYCRSWHNCLELWFDEKSVTLGDRTLKPIKITRTLDRVLNRGMELLAGCVVGEDSAIFNFRAIGDGAITQVSLADTDMYNLIGDIIDVNNTPEGGSLSRDGTTIMSVGNHSKEVPTPVNNQLTECGMFDSDIEETRNMFDHSGFNNPIPHTQNVDSPGSTTVIYMCSG